jgi:hypothetical protein
VIRNRKNWRSTLCTRKRDVVFQTYGNVFSSRTSGFLWRKQVFALLLGWSGSGAESHHSGSAVAFDLPYTSETSPTQLTCALAHADKNGRRNSATEEIDCISHSYELEHFALTPITHPSLSFREEQRNSELSFLPNNIISEVQKNTPNRPLIPNRTPAARRLRSHSASTIPQYFRT